MSPGGKARLSFLLSLSLSTACGGAQHGPRSDGSVVNMPAGDPPYLWYAGAGLNAFTRAETEVSDDQGARFLLIPRFAVVNYHDLAFDGGGNLWAVPLGADQIIRLPATQLPPAGTSPGPDLVLSSPALHGPQSLTFDARGNLWVVCYDGAGQSIATILRFDDPGGLTGQVALSPSAIIGPGADDAGQRKFRQPSAIAFDSAGSLWFVATENALRFDHPEGINGEVTPSPAAAIATGDAFASVAFDGDGSMWLTAANGGYFVVRIGNPGALAGAIAPAFAAKVHLPSAGTLFAGGMAFDGDGALWVAMNDRIVKLDQPGSLGGEVSPDPDVTLGVTASPDLSSKLLFH